MSIFSDIDGLYNADPRKNPEAQLIPVVTKLTKEIEAMGGGSGSSVGTGGMATKLMAARICMDAGCDMAIASGKGLHPLSRMANTQTTDDTSESSDVAEEYKEEALAESEQMTEQVQDLVAQYGIQDQVEIDFNAEYVLLNLNGAVLFDSGKSEIKSEAYPLMDKIGKILQSYQQNMIEIEGHTDNIPFTHSSKYENNDVLSMYRALYVADYMRNITTIDPSHIKSSGRGEYVPIADNSTPEGRARNRRVEIKIYNSYYSEIN